MIGVRIIPWVFFPQMSIAAATTSHSDPISLVLFWITLILFSSILGRFFAARYKQPAVLGELLMGILLGNLCYFFNVQLVIIVREGTAIYHIIQQMLEGLSLAPAVHANIANGHYAAQVITALQSEQGTELIKIASILDVFARFGVIFLLFKVGLESSVQELMHTGREALYVALIGVIAPMILGFFIICGLIPELSSSAALFVAATLSATSVGITVRVLEEMKKLNTREARTILGAAMLDDIFGLIILAMVSSLITNGFIETYTICWILFAAALFFAGALLIGPWFLRKLVLWLNFLKPWEAKLFISFLFLMILSWLATLVHLAAIIGAFTAGLIIHDSFFEKNATNGSTPFTIHYLITPIEALLAPLFFMLVGMQVKLESFLDVHVLFVALGLVFAAVSGKLLSGLGGGRQDDRWVIGLGMLPRGEVGLIFASIGRTLGVFTDQLFSAIVLMVIVTTLIAPPLIKHRMKNKLGFPC